MPTVLGELRCGHITSVSLGWAGVSCFELCPAVVPCATTDGESGSSFNNLNSMLLQKLISKRFSVK